MAAVAVVTGLWVFLAHDRAIAMCGGNIFAACPTPVPSAAAMAAKDKRAKRLEAVNAKKRRYPLGSR